MIAAQESAEPTPETLVMVRLTLPAGLMDHFEAQAAITGVQFETYLLEHLTRTRYHTSENPLYIEDNDRVEIQRLLGAKVNTPERLLDMIRRLVTWKVGTHKLELTPNQIEQIAGYARTMGRPAAEIAPGLIADTIAARFQTR